MSRRALITGINGQDGSYLAEFLLGEGYDVMGTVRRHQSAANDYSDIGRLPGSVEIVESDPAGRSSIEALLTQFRPGEVYNLAARASSSQLWTDPVSTGEVNGLAVVQLLDAIHRVDPRIRFLQASSSELFGNAAEVPQDESTKIQPRNPYGVAKAFGHWMTGVYRAYQGLYACSCILYNHESPRRSKEFVTRKISYGAAKIKLGLANELRLGDLNAKRDWGFAGDYVRAMWLALQHSEPDDYIVATGETHSVHDFCEIAFSHVGLRYDDYVVQDRQSTRSREPVLLVGNPSKAKRVLGWSPTITFGQLVVMMVNSDLRFLEVNSGRDKSSNQVGALNPADNATKYLGDK